MGYTSPDGNQQNARKFGWVSVSAHAEEEPQSVKLRQEFIWPTINLVDFMQTRRVKA